MKQVHACNRLARETPARLTRPRGGPRGAAPFPALCSLELGAPQHRWDTVAMADLAFNNGSCGLAFEPLRDDGPLYRGVNGAGMRTWAGQPRPASATFRARGHVLPQNVAGAPMAATAESSSREMSVPLRCADRMVPPATRMSMPAAKRFNQIVQHVVPDERVLHLRLDKGMQGMVGGPWARGPAPVELGGGMPTEIYTTGK